MIDLRPKVLEYVKIHGPILPVHVSRVINSNILFSSAVLSELVSNGDVFMSSAKIGGSSLYYTKGQEPKLQSLREYLGDMPKKAYDLLKQRLVLLDKAVEPYQRVAFRELKDFAVPLTVKYNDQETLFWKWYLTTDDNATSIIKDLLNIRPEAVHEEEIQEKIEGKKDYVQKELQTTQETKKEDGNEILKKQQKKQAPKTGDEVMAYFKKNNISIISTEPIKKNKETMHIVNIESQIGGLKYMAYFKDKKKIGEEDIILAYHKGQQHKMPVLFIATGELSKQAEEYINKNLRGLLMFKKI